MKNRKKTEDSGRKHGPRLLKGLGVSTGVAIGPAYVVEAGIDQVPRYAILFPEIDDELQRFSKAVEKARSQLSKISEKASTLPEGVAEEIRFLLDAHLAILSGSRLIRGIETRIRRDLINAEYAVREEVTAISAQFATMEDAYLASRAADIKEAGRRLVRNLLDRPFQIFSDLPEGSVIVADEITPADTALMDPRRIGGFATTQGGAEGHTAIMARSLGLPAVLGVPGLLAQVSAGDLVIVDGIAGRIFVDPDADTLAEYRRRQDVLAADREQLKSLIALPSRTADGHAITLEVNIELPREVPDALMVGADGVGLLRTEFLFMNRSDLPDEEEQYAALRGIVEGLQGRPVTLRTLDVGGDKLAHALNHAIGDSPNPALGLRAIRLSLREVPLLETQLAAMLRAGAHGPVRILLPMVTSVEQVRLVRGIMARVVRRLKRRGVPMAHPLPPLGVMIEVPGAALAADALAQVADFFSLGTNDLIQYTLAIDRGDEQVASLYDPLHPAVLRLIQFTAEAALRARISVSVCGEMAGDPRFTSFLIGLGIRELSMSPASLLPVKRRLRETDVGAAIRQARVIMAQTDRSRIAELLEQSVAVCAPATPAGARVDRQAEGLIASSGSHI